MSTLSRPGAVLDLSVSGEGATTVVLHGMTSSRAHELAAGISLVAAVPGRAVAYDARGHGRSTGRAVAEDYAWPALAEDLVAVVAAFGDVPVDGIGASMGTATLLTAAVDHPGAFRRLVLAIPPTAWETRAAQAVGYRAMATLVERAGLPEVAVPVPPALGDRALPAPDVRPGLLPSILRGAAVSDLPAPEALRLLNIPVLLLPWVGDPTHPVETAERLLELLPQATMHVAATPADLARRGALVTDFLAA